MNKLNSFIIASYISSFFNHYSIKLMNYKHSSACNIIFFYIFIHHCLSLVYLITRNGADYLHRFGCMPFGIQSQMHIWVLQKRQNCIHSLFYRIFSDLMVNKYIPSPFGSKFYIFFNSRLAKKTYISSRPTCAVN